MKRSKLAALAIALCLASPASFALQVNFTFNGVLTNVFSNPVNPFGVVLGDTVTVNGMFDDVALTGSGSEAVFFGVGSGNMLAVEIGNTTFNDTQDTGYAIGTYPRLNFLDGVLTKFEFITGGPAPTFATGGPLTPGLQFEANVNNVSGVWDASTFATTPKGEPPVGLAEPSSIALMAIGLAGVASIRRRKKI